MRAMAMTGCALLATFVVAEQTQAADVPPVNRNLRVESLGTPVKRRMGNWVLMYRAPADGALHLFCSFAAANGYTDDPPSEILDFNLGTGEIVHVPGPQGGTYLRPGWVHPNGKMYCTTTRPVTLLEYDPVAKKLRITRRSPTTAAGTLWRTTTRRANRRPISSRRKGNALP